jgi:hypothetical protein
MNPLLLTATINTQGCSCEFYNDQKKRANDYITTVYKYLKHTNLDLVVIENSKCLFDYIPEDIAYEKRIEWIMFDGNSDAAQFGKGHAEGKAILRALDVSKKLTKARTLFKVSGRYFARDIGRVIEEFDDDKFDALFEGRNGNHFHTVFFGMQKNYFYANMVHQTVNDATGRIFEHVIGEVAQTLPSERISWIKPLQYDETIVGGSLSVFKGY